jgi:carbohydrate kinase (thermoresistant glucokinase family)
MNIVVMGVAGAGKSLVGAALAAELGMPFVDADDLHPAANVAKMRAGIPLTDDDRWPWLDLVAAALGAAADAGAGDAAGARGAGLVMACSALRRSYRDRIRAGAPGTVFLELDGSPELLSQRIGGRVDHFMPPALLVSQLATLEPLGPDEPGARIDVAGTPAAVVARALAALPRSPSDSSRS